MAPTSVSPYPATPTLRALQGVRVVSLALNLPGPAALMRLQSMGATCTKVEPPQGDPMAQYQPQAYEAMHTGLERWRCNLKDPQDQQTLHERLAQTDVIVTSFRPSALRKLGLDWPSLHAAHPQLSCVAVFGAPGERAEEAGHDLTYQADAGLIQGLNMPSSLLADMAGALLTSEAVLQAVLTQQREGVGQLQTVALSSAAEWMALPLTWGLTTPTGLLGGDHAGYRVYACLDGRVALAALEPHFAQALCEAMDWPYADIGTLHQANTHQAIRDFMARHSRAELDALAAARDIPLHTLS
jgi:alpha-methylacyl-CoA racemase